MQKIISITAHILDIVSLKHRHEFRTVSVSSTLSKLSRKICASVRREIPRTHLIKGRKRFIIQPLRQSLPKGFTKSAASRQALKNPLFNMKMNLVSQTFFMCVLLGWSKGKSAFLLNSADNFFFPQFVMLVIGLCCTTNGIYVFKIQSKLAASNQLGVGNLLQVEQNAGGTPTGLSTNGTSADRRYTRK